MANTEKIMMNECIYLRNDEYYYKYMYNDIYQIAVSGRCCNIYLSPDRSQKISLSITLIELMKFLPTHIFMRTHRSYVVNINHIERITGNMLYVGDCIVPIGREYKETVYSRLNIVGVMSDNNINT